MRLLAARAEKPEAANRLRKALRALMKHAIEIGLRSDDPSRDTKAIRVKSDGYHSWSEHEIELFEATHPMARVLVWLFRCCFIQANDDQT